MAVRCARHVAAAAARRSDIHYRDGRASVEGATSQFLPESPNSLPEKLFFSSRSDQKRVLLFLSQESAFDHGADQG